MSNFDPYYKWLGIAPKDRPISYYRLLGLSDGESNPDVIENAADKQMVFLRQHAGGKHQKEAAQLLNEVSQARLVLLDPKKKAAYDEKLLGGDLKLTSRPPAPGLPMPGSAPLDIDEADTWEDEAVQELDDVELFEEQELDDVELIDEDEPAEEESAAATSIVATTPTVSSGGSKGSAGRGAGGSQAHWAKENFHWIAVIAGGAIVAFFFLVVGLKSLLSSPEDPVVAGGPDINNSSEDNGTTPELDDEDTGTTRTTPYSEADDGNDPISTTGDNDPVITDDDDPPVSVTDPDDIPRTTPVRPVDRPPSLGSAFPGAVTSTSPNAGHTSNGTPRTVVVTRPGVTTMAGIDNMMPSGLAGYWPIEQGEVSSVVEIGRASCRERV